MNRKTYYSVQTSLCYTLQQTIYANHHVYVATAFDAAGNDPTSNPKQIAALWLRVAGGSGTEEDLERWEQHKERLRLTAFDLFERGKTGQVQYSSVIEQIAKANLRDATPVLLTIPHSADYTLLGGDAHPDFASTEEEYLIPDLKPEHTFTVTQLQAVDLETL